MLIGIVAPALVGLMESWPWMSLGSLLAAAVVFAISYPQKYETGPQALIIKSGLTTRVIEYSRIRGLQQTKDGRVAVDYGIGNVLIAPEEMEAFLNDVGNRMKRDGNGTSDTLGTK